MEQTTSENHEISSSNIQADLQKELLWKSRQLQDYVDNASIGLHWVNEKGIIKWANRAELDMLGYTEEEYIGHHIAEFHVEQKRIDEILHRLSCNETLNAYESILRCKDGTTKTVLISSNVFWDDGKFIHTRCFTIDVSEQTRLFNALKESEASYKSLIGAMPAGIYTCDMHGRITFYNELAARLWGYAPAICDESIRFCAGCKFWLLDGSFVSPEDTPMAAAIKTGQSFRNFEALFERPDGSRFYACINIDPLRDEHNTVIGAINVFQDITTLKQTELALRTSERRYKELIETLETPLYTTDTQGRITMYNRAAAALWGRDPEIGKDQWCGSYKIFNLDGSDLPLMECPMAVCLREQRPVFGEQILVVRPNGALRHVAPHPQPIFDESGQMTGAINMLVDITEIKRAEMALRESESQYRELANSLEKKVKEKTLHLEQRNQELQRSEERYHRMVDQVEDYAIILLDKDGSVQNWNKGAERIKGYAEHEIVGSHFSKFYLPEDREIGLPDKLLSLAKATGKTIHEGWRVRKDGTVFWASVVLTALHDNDNQVFGFSKVTRDLTERKLSEDRMREYTNQLEFQNKELEQFAYAASHDLKEPIRKIQIYNSSIAENAAHVLDEQSKDFLRRSTSAAKRMSDLIDDLLSYSKMTAGTESFESVDLNAVLEEVILAHKEEIEQSSAQILYEHLPVIHGVPFQLRQLMTNLISNSLKYKHPERPVKIKVTSGEVNGSMIRNLNVQPLVKYHRVSVIDNGVGFDTKYAEKIFDIFKRLDNSPTAQGSGIGLAICKRIVQNHHGFITANAKENVGAIFDIYLPGE